MGKIKINVKFENCKSLKSLYIIEFLQKSWITLNETVRKPMKLKMPRKRIKIFDIKNYDQMFSYCTHQLFCTFWFSWLLEVFTSVFYFLSLSYLFISLLLQLFAGILLKSLTYALRFMSDLFLNSFLFFYKTIVQGWDQHLGSEYEVFLFSRHSQS